MFEVFARESSGENLGLIVLLPGRGQSAKDMLVRYHRFSTLDQFSLVAIEPDIEWYPAPKGSQNQSEAVSGLESSVPQLDCFISELEEEFNVDRSQVVLAGFSAGAVIAIQIAAHTENPFNAVVCHNGAILEPDNLPKSVHPTNYFVFHNENDDCFSWEERYLPMKNALMEKGYELKTLEGMSGGHYISFQDVKNAGLWIREQFDLPLPEISDDSFDSMRDSMYYE